MRSFDRRRFLAFAGGGAVCGLGVDRRALHPGSVRERTAAPSLDAIATVLRETDRDKVFERAMKLHEEGATWRDLLGGAFLAGVHEIVPRPVGFKFHAVMMTSSAFQVGEAVPENLRLLTALYNIADFKRSQARDRADGDWQLPASRADRAADPTQAGARLVQAMDKWNEDAADVAVAELHAASSIDDAFEVLWPYGARDFGNIGHKMIYTAQAYRTLQQIGWRYGEPVLRSLVYGLLHGTPGENDATFAVARELSPKIRDGWIAGDRDPDLCGEILARMRTADPQQAARAVVDCLNGKAAPQSVWDGLRLFALELLMRMPGILAVHPVTTLNAFRYAFDRTPNDATRRLLLLQAASWSSLFRTFLAGRRGFDGDRAGVDALASDDVQLDAAAATARRALVRKVKEHHDYKYTAAALEEIGLADPRWQPAMMAAAAFYFRTMDEDDGPFYREAAPVLGL